MTNAVYDFDKDLTEYFEFTVRGFKYRVQHLNTEQMAQLKEIQADDKKSQEFLGQFITPVAPEAPSFAEVSKKMIAPQWNRFQAMIKTEFSAS